MANKYHSAIVKNVAKQTGCSVNDVNNIINKFLIELSDSLREGTTVTVRDFGTFKLTTRAARTGRNIQTGEIIEIPEKQVVSFKPASRILEYAQIYKN